MKVPLNDLLESYERLKQEIDSAVARVLGSGRYISGPEVEAFEADFALYCEAACCVGVASGFDALQLGLRALGIGPKDEVIVASNSFAATVLAVRAVGATPIFVEPCPDTFNLDPDRVEAAVGPRTRALLPTHLYGQPADLDPLLALARRHGLKLVEDAAQAHGARYKGRRLGGHGDLVAWSFYPTKNLGGMGDGGAVTTDDPALAEAVRMLGNYGFGKRHCATRLGINSRLDPLQAAILGAKLPHLDLWNRHRRTVAAAYREGLADTSLELPRIPSWAEPVWHLYVARTPRRDELRTYLSGFGIGSDVHYPVPPHLQPAFADTNVGAGGFPIAERLAHEAISLPMGPHLLAENIEAVVAAVAAWDAEDRPGAARPGNPGR